MATENTTAATEAAEEKKTAAKKTASAAKKTTAAKKPAAEKKSAAAKKAAEPKKETAAKPKKSAKKPAGIQIRLVKSMAGRLDNQIATCRALGLRKIGDVTVQPDNAATRGKLAKVGHLVEVTEA